MVELLQVKITKVWGTLYDWVSLEIFTLRVVYIEPSAISQLQVRFSTPELVPTEIFLFVGFCFSSLLLYSPVCLSNIWYGGLPCDLTSLNRSRKSFWFFSLFSFILVRTEWWFLSSFHVISETGSWQRALHPWITQQTFRIGWFR